MELGEEFHYGREPWMVSKAAAAAALLHPWRENEAVVFHLILRKNSVDFPIRVLRFIAKMAAVTQNGGCSPSFTGDSDTRIPSRSFLTTCPDGQSTTVPLRLPRGKILTVNLIKSNEK